MTSECTTANKRTTMVTAPSCAVCKQHVATSTYCSACGANFCDGCWGSQIAHEPGRKSDLRHEKSDPGITRRIQEILTPSTDRNIQRQLHMNDADTTWLRYTRPSLVQEPKIEEYGRYKKLMQDSFTTQFTERWPQLVSFIGLTGNMLKSETCTRFVNNNRRWEKYHNKDVDRITGCSL